MYIRRDRKKNKGKETTYLSIAHNVVEESPKGKRTKPIVFANLGSEDEISGEMASSIARAFERYAAKRLGDKPTAEQLATEAAIARLASPGIRILASRELGMRLLLSAPWKALGIGEALKAYEKKHRVEFPLERIVFVMVLNRLVDPRSKRACNEWAKKRGYVPEARGWQVQHFYRALDILHDRWEELETLLAKQLDKLLTDEERRFCLIDTTSLYFESQLNDREVALLDEAWEDFEVDGTVRAPRRNRPAVVNETEFRMQGHNKDGHPESPQVVIANVCTPGGLLLHHRVYPGNTADATIAKDLAATLPRSSGERVWVSDAGMVGKELLATLDAAGWKRLTAEPPRKSAVGKALLDGLSGRFRKDPDRDHIGYRTVDVAAGDSPSGQPERWVITRNERERERHQEKIDKHVERVKVALSRKTPDKMAHAKAVCEVATHISLKKYVRPSDNITGTYVLDQDAITQERKLAGTRFYRTTLLDVEGPAIMRAYGQLQDVEAKHKQMKHVLALRPCYHRAERRIRAHIMLTVLAANCATYLERTTGQPFERLKAMAEDVKASEIEQGNSRYWQRTEVEPDYESALDALGIKLPPIVWTEWIEGAPKTKNRKPSGSRLGRK